MSTQNPLILKTPQRLFTKFAWMVSVLPGLTKQVTRIGKILSLLLLSATLSVLTANPTLAQTNQIKEDLSFHFFIDNNYKVRLEGYVNLINKTSRDISITEYTLSLPAVKLKNTKVSKLVPSTFLVDNYEEKGSNLFKIKSSQRNPVVLPPNTRIQFAFTSDIESPFISFQKFKIFDFPFLLDTDSQHIDLQVSVGQSLPLILAPDTERTEWDQRIFTLTQSKGKTLVFLEDSFAFSIRSTSSISDMPLYSTLTSNACVDEKFISCENCTKGRYDSLSNFTFSPKILTEPAILVTNVLYNKTCAIEKFQKLQNETVFGTAITKENYSTGLTLYPQQSTIFPAKWTNKFFNDSLFYIESTELKQTNFPFAWDKGSFFHIPLINCTTDTECQTAKEKLANITFSIGEEIPHEDVTISGIDKSDISLFLKEQVSLFAQPTLVIRNNSDSLKKIAQLKINANAIFSELTINNMFLFPQSSEEIPLNSLNRIPLRVIPENITVFADNLEYQISVTENSHPYLIVIYILSILFIISSGVFLISITTVIIKKRTARVNIIMGDNE